MNKVKSSKPKKQRKFHYHKPLHAKQSSLSAQLDKKLRKELGTKTIPVRKNDVVKVLSGKKKGSSGKVTAVNYAKGVVFIDKVTRKKANGEEILVPINASNLVITEADRNDSRRFKRKAKQKTAEKAETKKEKAKAAGKESEKSPEPRAKKGK